MLEIPEGAPLLHRPSHRDVLEDYQRSPYVRGHGSRHILLDIVRSRLARLPWDL